MDPSRLLVLDIRAGGCINAIRTVVVPQHPRVFESSVQPVDLTDGEPRVSPVGPEGRTRPDVAAPGRPHPARPVERR